MKKMRYEKAQALYKKAADKDTANIEAQEKLAEVFALTGDNQSAEAIYGVLAANPAAKSIDKFNYAQLLRTNGKYDEAAKAYATYAQAEPNSAQAAEFKNFGTQIKPLTQDLKTYELTNLLENSNGSDMGPSYFNGNLVITSNRRASGAVKQVDFWSGNGFYDLYTIPVNDSANAGLAQEPQKMGGKINKRLNDGPATFTRDDKEMIFTRTNKKKGPNGMRTLGLYHADWDATKQAWVNVLPLSLNSEQYNVAQPALSKDGSKLYFVSDMPGGEGGTDIFVAEKQGITWGQPVNLGKGINTPGREMFPFMAYDGTLFFASDSRVGLGGLDIYSATLSMGKWGNATNLGTPVNSTYDDFGYVADDKGKIGYIASNRPGGLGDDDIYKFVKKSEALCGTVADSRTKEGVEGVTVTFTSPTGEVASTRTNSKGDFCINLTPGREYRITTEKEAFFAYSGTAIVKAAKNERQNIIIKAKGGIDLVVDVTEKGNGGAEGATVTLTNQKTGETMEQESPADGKVTFDVFPDQQYDLKVVKKVPNDEGIYDKVIKTISTMGFKPSQTINTSAQITFYDSSFVFALPNVYFDYNSYVVKNSAKAELDKVVKVMTTIPYIELELSSHTDCRGSAEYNLKLSAQRAQACVNYLVTKGVDKKRMIAIGYGEMKIRNECVDNVPCTEAQHLINRRSEFRIVKFD